MCVHDVHLRVNLRTPPTVDEVVLRAKLTLMESG